MSPNEDFAQVVDRLVQIIQIHEYVAIIGFFSLLGAFVCLYRERKETRKQILLLSSQINNTPQINSEASESLEPIETVNVGGMLPGKLTSQNEPLRQQH